MRQRDQPPIVYGADIGLMCVVLTLVVLQTVKGCAMRVIRIEGHQEQNGRTAVFKCPGCNGWHSLTIDKPNVNGARWTWNGSLETPTFAPSYNERVGPWPDGTDKAGQVDVCHSFIENGQIRFLSDCTHAMRGQTVPLPPIDVPVPKVRIVVGLSDGPFDGRVVQVEKGAPVIELLLQPKSVVDYTTQRNGPPIPPAVARYVPRDPAIGIPERHFDIADAVYVYAGIR